MREHLASEAEECRRLIPEFSGRPEEPFLLKLASAFEELALQEDLRSTEARTQDGC